MHLTRQDLEWATTQGLITPEQAVSLWEALRGRDRGWAVPAFDLVHILYAFGAILVVAAMTWFTSEAWQRYGGGAIGLIALVYGGAFVALGRRLRRQAQLHIAGGIFYTLAVAMVPLAIWGFQQYTGIWVAADQEASDWYHLTPQSCRLVLEAATIAAGAAALRWTRFPLVLAPMTVAAWAMALDLTLWAMGGERLTDAHQSAVAVVFGLAVLLAGYLVDRRTEVDYAFWGYLFGVAAFWGGLTSMESHNEWSKLLYCGINVALMGLSVLLARRVFILFGAFGVFVYLADLASRLFKDSLLFPAALVALGAAIIYLGTRYQRNRVAVEAAIKGALPASVRRLLPTERGVP